MGHLTDRASAAASEIGSVPDKVRETAEGNPLAAGVVAFGLGAIAASLVPLSRREEELIEMAQPGLERIGAEAADVGRSVMEDIKPEVAEAAETVKDETMEAAGRIRSEASTSDREPAKSPGRDTGPSQTNR